MAYAKKPTVIPLVSDDCNAPCFDGRQLQCGLPYVPRGSTLHVFNVGYPDPSKRVLLQLTNQVVMFPVNRPGEKRGKFESTKYTLDLPIRGFMQQDPQAVKLVNFFEGLFAGASDFVEKNHEAFLPMTESNPTDEDRMVNAKMAKKKLMKLVKYDTKNNKYDPRVTFKLRWNPETKEVLTAVFVQPANGGPVERATIESIQRGAILDILFGVRGMITPAGIQLSLVAEQIRVHPAERMQLDTSVPQFLDAPGGAQPSAAVVAAAAAVAATAATEATAGDVADEDFADEDM